MASRRREAEAHRGVNPGGGDVVAVADPGHGQRLKRALLLLQRHDIGEDLAGMRLVGKAVDDRHGRVFCKLDQLFMRGGAHHDRVDIARQHEGRVGDGFAAAKLHVRMVQHDGLAAELAHGDVEGNARAGRAFLEQHGEHGAFRELGPGARAVLEGLLERVGAIQDQPQCIGIVTVDIQKVTG